MLLEDIFQYGWLGYGFIVSCILFAAAWAILPAKVTVRLTKAEGKARRIQFWLVYIVSAIVLSALVGVGVSVALKQMFN